MRVIFFPPGSYMFETFFSPGSARETAVSALGTPSKWNGAQNSEQSSFSGISRDPDGPKRAAEGIMSAPVHVPTRMRSGGRVGGAVLA